MALCLAANVTEGFMIQLFLTAAPADPNATIAFYQLLATIVGAIVTIITIVVGAYMSIQQGVKNSAQNAEIGKKVDDGVKQNEVIIANVKDVKEQTDGHATALTEQVGASRSETAALVTQVVDLAKAMIPGAASSGSKGDRVGDVKV